MTGSASSQEGHPPVRPKNCNAVRGVAGGIPVTAIHWQWPDARGCNGEGCGQVPCNHDADNNCLAMVIGRHVSDAEAFDYRPFRAGARNGTSPQSLPDDIGGLAGAN